MGKEKQRHNQGITVNVFFLHTEILAWKKKLNALLLTLKLEVLLKTSELIVAGPMPEAEASSLSAPREALVWPPATIGRATCLATNRKNVRLVSSPNGSRTISKAHVKQSMAF